MHLVVGSFVWGIVMEMHSDFLTLSSSALESLVAAAAAAHASCFKGNAFFLASLNPTVFKGLAQILPSPWCLL